MEKKIQLKKGKSRGKKIGEAKDPFIKSNKIRFFAQVLRAFSCFFALRKREPLNKLNWDPKKKKLGVITYFFFLKNSKRAGLTMEKKKRRGERMKKSFGGEIF